MITSSPLSFQDEIAISNRLSDFPKVMITVMKMKLKKDSPKERQYKDYNILIRRGLQTVLEKNQVHILLVMNQFENIFNEVLNKHVPLILIRMDLLEVAHGWGGCQKAPPSLKSVTYIRQR